MGEKIFDWIKSLATGKNSRVFWGIIILLLIVVVIIFPYIDANFLYYNRIEKRIDNLSALVELSGNPIENSPELLAEYNSIIAEISNAQGKSISPSSDSTTNNKIAFWGKFSGGAFLFALMGVIMLFKKNDKQKPTFSAYLKNNLLVSFLCLIIAGILGYIFSLLPVIFSVWVNAIAAPIIQLIVLYLFMQPKKQ